MTKMEAYKAVIAGEVTEEVVAKFEELVEMEHKANARKREQAAAKRAEKIEAEKVLEDAILAVLGDEPMSASMICEAVEELKTPQKTTVVAKRLVEAGKVAVQDMKGKSGKVKGYTLA